MKRSAPPGSRRPRRPTALAAHGLGARKLRRKEQQRAINTRVLILRAALSEFSQQGFEAASIRNIAERIGVKHPLITYHYKTKDILWRAVAEHVFSEIRNLWDQQASPDSDLPPIERVRAEYRTLLRFTLEYPDFHHFMLRESRPHNPRLAWLVTRHLKPLLKGRLMPQLKAAQRARQLPKADPALIHYMLIGMISVLSSLADEIRLVAGISPHDPRVVDNYWQLIELAVFKAPSFADPN